MEGSSSLVMSALDTEIRRGTWTYGGGHGNTRGSTGMAHWPFPACGCDRWVLESEVPGFTSGIRSCQLSRKWPRGCYWSPGARVTQFPQP